MKEMLLSAHGDSQIGQFKRLLGSKFEVCNFGIHNDDHCIAGDEPMEDDKIFIAASRTDIPALLDHIKALEEESGRLKNRIKEVGVMCKRWYREANDGYSVIGALRKELIELQEGNAQ